MSSGGILKEKSFAFAVRIVKLHELLMQRGVEVIGRQILRSGTAIGALLRESELAESRKDFIHKLHIAAKEANETSYWLELLFSTGHLPKALFSSIHNDVIAILKMLIASIKSLKKANSPVG